MKDRIRQLMEAQHMNQQAFARFTNIGTASLSSIFTGRTRPTMNHVVAIMEAFPKVNPTWLIKGEGPMMTDGSGDNTWSDSQSNPSSLLSDTDPSTTLEQGDLFSSNSFIEPVSLEPEPKVAPVTQRPAAVNPRPATYSQRHVASTPTKGMVSQIKVQKNATDNLTVGHHHITEIRVFFDDQTWESFIPKKSS